MDFDDFGEINFDDISFGEVGEGDFDPLPDFEDVEFDDLPEFEDPEFNPFTADVFTLLDESNPNPFERDDRLRYADESPPTGNESIRGPFRDTDHANRYLYKLPTRDGLSWQLIYDGEMDLWYIAISADSL